MKMKNLLTVCGVAAALMLSAGSIFAQDDNGGPPGGAPGGASDSNAGGPGGGRGGRNFDPAQMQQRMMQRVQEQLGLTNDTEWSAVQPLVQKVMETQRAARGNLGRMFGRGGRNGNNGGPGGGNGPFAQQSDPAADALQQALGDSAPAAQVKDLLAKYQASHKAKLAALATAQENLRKVLTPRQEAQATLMGLLD